MAQRPVLVTLVGLLNILLGTLLFFFGLISIVGVTFLALWKEPENAWAFFTTFGLTMIVGIVEIIIGTGMLKGYRIMWYLGMIFAVIDIVVSALNVFSDQNAGIGGLVLTVIIEGIIVYYLTRPGVKKFFNIE